MNRLRSKMKGICCLETKVLVTLLFVAIAATPAWASDWLSGPHQNINIIGTKNCGEIPSGAGGGNRATIFVPLTTTGDTPGAEPETTTFDATDTSIFLIQGSPIAVCNGDACTQAVNCATPPVALGNGRMNGAVLQLPCDNVTADDLLVPCSGTSAWYCIYAAAAGSPKTINGEDPQAQITTCAVLPTTNDLVCSTNNAMIMRDKGGPVVQDVTAALTTLTCTVGVNNCPSCGGPAVCTFALFNTGFQFFLWDYDNAGLKIAKLRIYPQPAGTETCPTP